MKLVGALLSLLFIELSLGDQYGPPISEAMKRAALLRPRRVIENKPVECLTDQVAIEMDEDRTFVADPEDKWPNGRVPYVISANFSSAERDVIAGAMATVEVNSGCITFVPKTSQDIAYMEIVNRTSGCYAYIGYRLKPRTLNLGPNCVHEHVVIHEILHILGTFHEHTRPDRDDFVSVNWSKISPGAKPNFYKTLSVDHSGPSPQICSDTMSPSALDDCTNGIVTTNYEFDYDYDSIMHYGRNYFSIDGNDTLQPKDSSFPASNLGGWIMTSLDTAKLRRAYGCDGCGGEIGANANDTGHIESVSGASKCEWFVKAPDGYFIEFIFTSFSYQDCIDSVSIIEDKFQQTTEYCSTNEGIIYRTSTSSARVVQNAGNNANNGFNITWRVLQAKCCNTINVSGNVNSNTFNYFSGNYQKSSSHALVDNAWPVFVHSNDNNIANKRYLGHAAKPYDNYVTIPIYPWIFNLMNWRPPGDFSSFYFQSGFDVVCPRFLDRSRIQGVIYPISHTCTEECTVNPPSPPSGSTSDFDNSLPKPVDFRITYTCGSGKRLFSFCEPGNTWSSLTGSCS